MKKLLFIALLLPIGLMAQKDSLTIGNKPIGFAYSTYSQENSSKWGFSKPVVPSIKVFDNINSNYPGKLLMETDTAGVIHVYGDTLSVLKSIMRSYNIKVKD